MYPYKHPEMLALLEQLLVKAVSAQQWQWLQEEQERYRQQHSTALFNRTFTAIARFIKKGTASPDAPEKAQLLEMRDGLRVDGWPASRLARAWWLLQLEATDEDTYVGQVESLFKSADMNEQVALYGSLPLLAFPRRFTSRCSEGVRTNMAVVFQAIALDNPYPSEYLDEAAWNQLVLKAFFMQMPVGRIIGLDTRANPALAHMLTDYARERFAAARSVDPVLWRPVGRFIDAAIFPVIEHLFASDNETTLQAASLASAQSSYEPAIRLLDSCPRYKKKIEEGRLTWQSLGQ